MRVSRGDGDVGARVDSGSRIWMGLHQGRRTPRTETVVLERYFLLSRSVRGGDDGFWLRRNVCVLIWVLNSSVVAHDHHPSHPHTLLIPRCLVCEYMNTDKPRKKMTLKPTLGLQIGFSLLALSVGVIAAKKAINEWKEKKDGDDIPVPTSANPHEPF
jgi:hypothetical protein